MAIEAESSPFSSREPRFSLCYEQDNAFPASAQAKPIGFLKTQEKTDPFHALYNVPIGDTPYGRAKHLQVNYFVGCFLGHAILHAILFIPFVYNVPIGDTPYGRAKHLQVNYFVGCFLGHAILHAILFIPFVWKIKLIEILRIQLVEKDPAGAIALFRKAINAGDRIDSALKDMAVVMNQQNRSLEAIETIMSFRHICSKQAQESLDNVLIDLFKKCGRFDEQIRLLKHKLRLIQQGVAFNGKSTKTARSKGRKFQVSIMQETTRILGNLGWAYMQQHDYCSAEIVYRKAQVLEPDDNKACNLSICLIRQGKVEEAMDLLQGVLNNCKNSTNYNNISSRGKLKSMDRVEELLKEIRELKTEQRTGEKCQSAASRVEDLEWVWYCEDGGGSQEEEKWGLAVEVNRKRNRLRVFQEMTSAPKEELAF